VSTRICVGEATVLMGSDLTGGLKSYHSILGTTVVGFSFAEAAISLIRTSKGGIASLAMMS